MNQGFKPAPMKHQRRRWRKIIWWLLVAGVIYLLVSGGILKNIFGQ